MKRSAMNQILRIGVTSLLIVFLLSVPVLGGVKILVIPKGSMSDFWAKVQAGALKAGEELKVEVTYRGPRNEDQHEAQLKIIDYGIQQSVDAIVLAPNHEQLPVPMVAKAVGQGIKVVIIDSNMNGTLHASFIESDNYRAGQQAGGSAATLLDGDGDVALIKFIENNASTDDRARGFLDALKAHHPHLRVIAAPYAGATVGSAYHAVSAIIDRFPSVALIFSVNESTTLGTLRTLREKHLQGRIKHIGFDFNEDLRDAIANREMDASIVQNPYKMGYLGVKIAYQLTQGKAVPKKIFTETVLITADNFETAEVQELLESTLNHPVD